MARPGQVPIKHLETRLRVGGGWVTVYRDSRGGRVYFQIAPGASLDEAHRRIRRRLAKPTT